MFVCSLLIRTFISMSNDKSQFSYLFTFDSDVLRSVQFGQSSKDVVDRYSHHVSSTHDVDQLLTIHLKPTDYDRLMFNCYRTVHEPKVPIIVQQ
jgi:hypothetical protein